MISAVCRYHIKYRKPGKRKNRRGTNRFGTYLRRPFGKTAGGTGNPGHGKFRAVKRKRILLPEPHRPSRFHPLYKPCLFVYNEKDESATCFGMEGIISAFFDFSIDGDNNFTKLLYPFLVVFNYELCFFYPWLQDKPI